MSMRQTGPDAAVVVGLDAARLHEGEEARDVEPLAVRASPPCRAGGSARLVRRVAEALRRSMWPTRLRAPATSSTVTVSWPLLATKTRRAVRRGHHVPRLGAGRDAPRGPNRGRPSRGTARRRVGDPDHGDAAAGGVGDVRVAAGRVEGHALRLVPDLDLRDDRVAVRADHRDAVVGRVDRPHQLAVERHRDGRRVRRARRASPSGRPGASPPAAVPPREPDDAEGPEGGGERQHQDERELTAAADAARISSPERSLNATLTARATARQRGDRALSESHQPNGEPPPRRERPEVARLDTAVGHRTSDVAGHERAPHGVVLPGGGGVPHPRDRRDAGGRRPRPGRPRRGPRDRRRSTAPPGRPAAAVAGHHITAWWSDSASDQSESRSRWAIRRGAAGSETSNSETWVPVVRPWPVARLADADQQVVADGLEVGREAGDLQLAAHRGVRRVAEVERVERVDLAEGDDVAAVADEADGVDALAAARARSPGPRARASRRSRPSTVTRLSDAPSASPRPPVRLLGARDAEAARPARTSRTGRAASRAPRRWRGRWCATGRTCRACGSASSRAAGASPATAGSNQRGVAM